MILLVTQVTMFSQNDSTTGKINSQVHFSFGLNRDRHNGESIGIFKTMGYKCTYRINRVNFFSELNFTQGRIKRNQYSNIQQYSWLGINAGVKIKINSYWESSLSIGKPILKWFDSNLLGNNNSFFPNFLSVSEYF